MTERITVLDKGYVRIVDHMGSDLSIVNAARVSYDKESNEMSERDKKLINYLVQHRHNSPFRHCVLTFEIYAPLFVARQWWKYAVASTHVDDQNGWNESSRRYVTEQEEFYIPTTWRSTPENSKQGSGQNITDSRSELMTHLLKTHYEQSEKLYKQALSQGIAAEQARLFLPAYGMYVRWRWTASLSSVIHFVKERMSQDAQKEIQQYAEAIRRLSLPLYPETFHANGIWI